MRMTLLFLGLLIVVGPSFAFSFSETNEYEVTQKEAWKKEVWAEFRNDAGEYPLQCRLDPQSTIRLVKEESGYVYATLLISAAWELPSSLASVRGACRKPAQLNLRVQKKKIEEWEGKEIHLKKH